MVRYFLALVALTMAVSGCTIDTAETPPTDSGMDTQTAEVIAEIDTLGNLDSEFSKRDGYMEMAARQALDARAQVRLVEAAFTNLFSGLARRQVLLSLIENPEFNCSAKMVLLQRLGEIISKDIRNDVLQALHKRGPCVGDAR